MGIRDLVLGETRLVVDRSDARKAGEEAESTAISPDGKRVAFAWCRWRNSQPDQNGCQLRIIGADGDGERVLLDGKLYGDIRPQSWSHDGKWIVVTTGGRLGPALMLVSPDGLPLRALRVSDGFEPRTTLLSQDGKWLAFNARVGGVSRLFVLPADGSAPRETEVIPDAWLLGWSPDGRFLIFYRERDDAHQLFLLPFADGRATGEARHFHSVYAAYNNPKGMTANGSLIFGTENFPADVVVAPVDAETAVIGPLSAPMPVKVVEPNPFLGGGARFSPDGGKIMYMTRPRTVLIRSLADGSDHTTTVQLAQVGRIEWAADSRSLFAGGRNSAGTSGIYRVDLTSGAATLVVETPTASILAPSPDGNTLYYFTGKDRKIMAHDLRSSADRLVAAPFGPVTALGHANFSRR